jgi:hypothetical protein
VSDEPEDFDDVKLQIDGMRMMDEARKRCGRLLADLVFENAALDTTVSVAKARIRELESQNRALQAALASGG